MAVRRRCPSCGERSLRRVGRHLFFCPICELYYRLDPLTGQIRAMNPLLSPPKVEEREEQPKPKSPISLWHEFLKEKGISPTTYKRMPPILKEAYRAEFRRWKAERLKKRAEEYGVPPYAYPFGLVGPG